MARLTPDQMVDVKAMAPFELAEIFTEWDRRWTVDAAGPSMQGRMTTEEWKAAANATCNGLGPPFRFHHEDPTDYGQRIAAGIITLLKEV